MQTLRGLLMYALMGTVPLQTGVALEPCSLDGQSDQTMLEAMQVPGHSHHEHTEHGEQGHDEPARPCCESGSGCQCDPCFPADVVLDLRNDRATIQGVITSIRSHLYVDPYLRAVYRPPISF